MNSFGIVLLLLSFLAGEGPPSPKIPVGKETTYVTGPLTKEGYIDYESALNDRLGKGVTAEKNANVLLFKAFGPTPEGGAMPAEYFKRLGIAEPPKAGAYFISIGKYLRDELKIDPSAENPNEFQVTLDQYGWATGRPWKAENYPNIAALLKANEKPLAVVLEATKRPEYFNPLVSRRTENEGGSLAGFLLPSVQKCRELGTVLSARAMLRVSEGKFDEAWQDLLACHRLARHVSRGGTLIESLVSRAIEMIACNSDVAYLDHAKLTSKQIQDRLKDLQELPPMASLVDKIDLSERFTYLDSLQLARRRTSNAGLSNLLFDGPRKEPTPEERNALASIDWEPAFRDGNQWHDRIVAALRITDRGSRYEKLDQIEADRNALKRSDVENEELLKDFLAGKVTGKVAGKRISEIMIFSLTPSLVKVQNSHDRVEQARRNLHVAFALVAYQREHGRYPAKLDALAPKYLTSIPNDLFAGKPLKYRPSEKGFLLYSVGVNGKDEDGRWYDDTPPGDDPRVRIPLPELKGNR